VEKKRKKRQIQGATTQKNEMLRKSVVLATIASASAFAASPAAFAARGVPAVATARPLSLRGGASAVKMVRKFSAPDERRGFRGAACAPPSGPRCRALRARGCRSNACARNRHALTPPMPRRPRSPRTCSSTPSPASGDASGARTRTRPRSSRPRMSSLRSSRRCVCLSGAPAPCVVAGWSRRGRAAAPPRSWAARGHRARSVARAHRHFTRLLCQRACPLVWALHCVRVRSERALSCRPCTVYVCALRALLCAVTAA